MRGGPPRGGLIPSAARKGSRILRGGGLSRPGTQCEQRWRRVGRRGCGKERGWARMWQPLSQAGVGSEDSWAIHKIGLDSLGLPKIWDLLLEGEALSRVSRMNWNQRESWNGYLCMCNFFSFLLFEKAITHANQQLASHPMQQVSTYSSTYYSPQQWFSTWGCPFTLLVSFQT